ncbi:MULTISPECIES: 5-deoxy-glucuronate isomerase [Micromonospora]|uniref:5-deoxy-glucuronate isomerase n=1 Tax=Micromonospora solifontis TaxID=2487138 RepID=A0ABX9WKH5_9ACTN|nr:MULTISPECIES: 5-deoxy-glucuronate isomerase [Micromonospora]NES14765.1 5-deoxy-glucuronate isomerase [Micromonospora sp. PPF5-17B]NES35329.1 5-deoxy-glucuronate isomerase [Micromonospora solifontis]NES56189.1 5-deoxy-glucuronate isomerase [Micromonospora sp. PPF5-6]RNM00830.1 5-deoxy-glucuronate isomerase [Micromonospora solifontis]
MYLPAGTAGGGDGCPVEITPERAGWRYCGLRVHELPAGGEITFETGGFEQLVLPLAGGGRVRCGGQTFTLDGRASVFDRVTDFVYLPIGHTVTISTDTGMRCALPAARATRRLPARYGPAERVPVEVRGAGPATRQVNNFCAPEAFECDRLVAVELLTPGGNWSSYPPHKHDIAGDGEAELEEIYYFETDGLAYQRVYGSTEVLAEVGAGDVVLVPDGYHGPSIAAPGYDLYYLNVLAGPAPERTMACRDDPAHHWVRASWQAQRPDERVPMTSHRGRTR